jgi:hypothetical protein
MFARTRLGASAPLVGGSLVLLMLAGTAVSAVPASAQNVAPECYPLGREWQGDIQGRDFAEYMDDDNNANVYVDAANAVLVQLKAHGCAPRDWPPERHIQTWG